MGRRALLLVLAVTLGTLPYLTAEARPQKQRPHAAGSLAGYNGEFFRLKVGSGKHGYRMLIEGDHSPGGDVNADFGLEKESGSVYRSFTYEFYPPASSLTLSNDMTHFSFDVGKRLKSLGGIDLAGNADMSDVKDKTPPECSGTVSVVKMDVKGIAKLATSKKYFKTIKAHDLAATITKYENLSCTYPPEPDCEYYYFTGSLDSEWLYTSSDSTDNYLAMEKTTNKPQGVKHVSLTERIQAAFQGGFVASDDMAVATAEPPDTTPFTGSVTFTGTSSMSTTDCGTSYDATGDISGNIEATIPWGGTIGPVVAWPAYGAHQDS